jgi:hypothetical protein
MRYQPKIRIYLIADNLSAHKTPDIRAWAEDNNIELVFTPTYASFPNRIECHFWAIGEFVVNDADYPDLESGQPHRLVPLHHALRLPRGDVIQGAPQRDSVQLPDVLRGHDRAGVHG